ncbi:MAG TPA: hypothetical protein VGG20_26855 [Thermoanaerobaculia bacterium]
MGEEFFDARIRRWTLGLLAASAFALSFVALREDNFFSELTMLIYKIDFVSFSAKEKVSLITPIVAGALAGIFHALDNWFKGGGIKDRINELKSKSYDLSAGAIAATITKQSVLIAIAAILLGVVQAYSREGDHAKSKFVLFSSEMSMIGFLLSIVLLLVSLKCYDYACRFKLKDRYKAELVRKGLVLDIWSWYLILFSLVVGVASLSPTLSIAVSFVVGYLLWWYYFIHPNANSSGNSGAADVGAPREALDEKIPQALSSEHG